MSRSNQPADEDKLRNAAENVVLLFVSRWSTVLLVPIIIGVGSWIVTSVQGLSISVNSLQGQITAQSKIFDEKLNAMDGTLSARVGSVERRVDRLEYQQDSGRKLPSVQR